MIKVIIFDIGGVTIRDPMTSIYKDVGIKFKISKEKVEENFYKLDPLIVTGKISAKEFWTTLAKGLKIKYVYLLEKVWLNSLKKSKPVNRKVVKIIDNLKENGYKVVTLSNTMEPHEKLHRKLGHYKFFDQVFLSNRLGMIKPDIRIYRYCIKELEVKPNECVFIDDKMVNVVGARKAGMKAILFKNTEQLEKDLKKYL